ncbi:SDR family oxidoreductase [Rhizobium sp. WW_1]|jgi:NAD(P)-dependent dehydrogenase (short-subunit alcohol dehydrogenase family)|uniref:SDR family oxidoreductase n=1 Tax=Rhizobium sp. WW_1 TaxID=1907375 RepID=UPI00064761D4|nr:SDR family oxidoreductase [Rhizobium sp. WW_1]RKD60833.1 NAD(P)-dependent dehydrogenase (short-subunit alcohol dehydrogenase family) [Rhizobium sp. WW_1]
MDLGLKDKVVLITGGSKGIGFACAELFQQEGARVAICSRSQANIDAALSRLPGVHGYAADLIFDGQALAVVDKVEADVGPIDILVNSAGAAARTPADELTPAVWRAAMDAKYFSYINVIDPVIKRMGARGSGAVINIIGNGGKVASPYHLAGGSANAALMLASVGLANAYAGKGVRVVGLNPGLTETDRVAEGLKAAAKISGSSEEEALADALKRIPIGRMADPADIANVVAFLSSAKAGYVTGVVISMDGAQVPVIV